ncbi:MAG: hypothetical protein Ta2G_13840 [Termitinemataceae bacterium]|nr:MAG: hypothetical protein Ta2G_13840 [Termitinemataceae bacterium]
MVIKQHRIFRTMIFIFFCNILLFWQSANRIDSQDLSNSIYGEFDFIEKGDDTLLLVDYTGTSKNIVIKEKYDGKIVSEIAGGYFPGAFSGYKLSSVIIPGTVTKIGEHAFDGNSLTQIAIGANIEISGAFESSFESVYKNEGKRAGVYTKEKGVWRCVEQEIARPDNADKTSEYDVNYIASLNIPRIIDTHNIKIHQVKQNETFKSIAALYYGIGNEKFFPVIMLASNCDFDPDMIAVRSRVVIPDLNINRNNQSTWQQIKDYFYSLAYHYRMEGNDKMAMSLQDAADAW